MDYRLENIIAGLPEYCRAYLMDSSKDLSETSLYMYGVDLNVFFQYLKKVALKKEEISLNDLKAVTNEDIVNYLSYLTQYSYNGIVKKNASSAKQRKLVVIRSFFSYMQSNGYMKTNPTNGVSVPPKTKKSADVLSPEEIDQILAFAKNPDSYKGNRKKDEIHHRNWLRDYLILVLLLFYHLSAPVVANLNVEDCKSESITYKERGKIKELALLPVHGEAFQCYLNSSCNAARYNFCKMGSVIDQDALFYSRKRNRISVRNIEVLSASYRKSVIIEDRNKTQP